MHQEIAKIANAKNLSRIKFIEPIAYFEMQNLLVKASIVFTDSGGLQKEAFFHKVPCVTLRDETEWSETVATGWNIVAGTNTKDILSAADIVLNQTKITTDVYGNGETAFQIIKEIKDYL